MTLCFYSSFQLSSDWQVDYESYDWRKLDPDSEECKTMVKEYFTWEGDFKHVGKAVNQGKVFKWKTRGQWTRELSASAFQYLKPHGH